MKTNNNFHILIIDDEKFNIELVAAYLKEEGYKLSFALNGEKAFECIFQKNVNLILLDVNMPNKNGFEICTMLKEDPKTKSIPVIFLTAQTDIEYIAKAFEVGGADYITKPFNGAELKARVKIQLQNIAYLEEIKHKQSKLAQLSITDSMTKLYNALYFDSQIKQYQKREEVFWILYFKINNFDKINKLYGFYGANKILRKFALLLKKICYANSIVAKLYGVSFGILTKDYAQKDIEKLYETIAVTLMRDAELKKIISFSAVLYNVKEKNTSPASIYKKLQNTTHAIDRRQNNYMII